MRIDLITPDGRYDKAAILRDAHCHQYGAMRRHGWSWSRCLSFSWVRARTMQESAQLAASGEEEGAAWAGASRAPLYPPAGAGLKQGVYRPIPQVLSRKRNQKPFKALSSCRHLRGAQIGPRKSQGKVRPRRGPIDEGSPSAPVRANRLLPHPGGKFPRAKLSS
jgi:hypothetical protein